MICKLGEFVWSDAYVGQLAESGIDAVDGLAGSEDLLDESSTLANAFLRGWCDCDLRTGDGDRLDLGKRERLAVEGESFHAKMVGQRDGRVQVKRLFRNPFGIAINYTGEL